LFTLSFSHDLVEFDWFFMCVFPRFSLVQVQYSANFATVLRRFEASGNNDPETFGRFIDTELILHYMYILFRDNSMVMDLVSRELGDEDVEGDAAQGCTTKERKPRAAKRGREDDRLLEAIVGNYAAVAKSFEAQADSSTLAALSQTLYNLADAGAPAAMIEEVQSQMWAVLRSTKGRQGGSASDSVCSAPSTPQLRSSKSIFDSEE